MKAVGAFGTISYGFSMILTVILIVLFGVGPAALGIQMLMDGTGQGILLILIGALIIYSGTLGLLYKVIADAVATGNKAAPTEEDLSLVESYLEEIEQEIKASEDEDPGEDED